MMRAIPSLFAKLFVWFWLTVALLLGMLLGGSWLLSRDPRTADPHIGNPFRIVAGTIEDLFRSGSSAELDSMLAGMERRESMTPYLVAGGRELRGHPLPGDAARVAGEVVRRDSPVLWAHHPRILFGYPLHGSRGERAALVLSPPPLPGPLRLLVPLTLLGPWMLLVIVFAAGLLCLALMGALVAPVRRLHEATRRLATGDLTARAGYAGRRPGDELEALAQDFDRMAERIERLVGTQQQLLRDISHELRSPLARMSVAIGLARERSDEKAQPLLDRIERESERLNELIGQLLTLARLEGEGAQVRWERVDLVELVDALVDDVRFEALPVARLVRRTGGASVPIQAHPELLRRAIENVLRNALRYTSEGGFIEVHVAEIPEASQARVTVRDHGPGVPADQLEAIFRPFHRAPDGPDQRTGGTGLGLTIAQRAVLAHGGSIVARNAPDGGLEVELQLPCVQGAPHSS